MTFRLTEIGSFGLSILLASVAYLVLALQLRMGMPPFYKRYQLFALPSDEEVKPIALAGMGITGLICGAVLLERAVLFLCAAAVAVLAAFQVRTRLR